MLDIRPQLSFFIMKRSEAKRYTEKFCLIIIRNGYILEIHILVSMYSFSE